MSDENDPKPTEEPSGSDTDNSATAAKEAAKDFANNAKSLFKGLDQKQQIYLIALAATALCSLLFGAFTSKVTMNSELEGFAGSASQIGAMGKNISPHSSACPPTKAPSAASSHSSAPLRGSESSFGRRSANARPPGSR